MADTKLVVCSGCKGKKNIVGLGFSIKKCDVCKGIGKTEEPIDEIAYLEKSQSQEKPQSEIIEQDKLVEDNQIKKRGRKKEVN